MRVFVSFRSGTLLSFPILKHSANFFSIQMLFWGHTAEEPPTDKITIGHENTGHVVAMGKNVKNFKVGDAVGCLGCSYACCK